MDMQKFIDDFAAQYDDQSSALTAASIFRDVEGWSSLIALSIIAMVDEEYGVTLSGDDIRTSNTIEDVFNKIVAKKGA